MDNFNKELEKVDKIKDKMLKDNLSKIVKEKNVLSGKYIKK